MRRTTWGRAAAEPDGDGLRWPRVDASVGDVVVAPVEVHHVLGPEHPHDLDLLGGAAAPVGKVLAEALVFHLVPAHADAQAQAAAGQHVYLGGLLGHQRGLTLAEDQYAGYKLQLLGDCAQVSEKHERLVEHVYRGCRDAPRTRVCWRLRPARGRTPAGARSPGPRRPARSRGPRRGRPRFRSAERWLPVASLPPFLSELCACPGKYPAGRPGHTV